MPINKRMKAAVGFKSAIRDLPGLENTTTDVTESSQKDNLAQTRAATKNGVTETRVEF